MDVQLHESASSQSAIRRLYWHGLRVNAHLTRLVRLVLASTLLAVIYTTVGASQAAAADSATGLHLSGSTAEPKYRLGEPVSLQWTVTNGIEASCQLSRVADGSLVITNVTRNGSLVVPALETADYVTGLAVRITHNLISVKPGSSMHIRLHSALGITSRSASTVIQTLQSVSWSPTEQDIATVWPLNRPGNYVISAVYALPGLPGLPDGACHGHSSAATVSFTVIPHTSGLPIWIVIGIIFVGLLVSVVAVILAWRLRRNYLSKLSVLAAVILVVATFNVIDAARADAKIVVPDNGDQDFKAGSY
jgi:hypothetical protein